MKNKILASAACFVLMVAALPAEAALQRLEAWGQGPSEFEAVKSAYKQITAQALKLSVARAATSEASLRRVFVRDIEEDLLRVQKTYFPESAPPQCREEQEHFECQVVAQAEMDELEARLRSLLNITGSATNTVHGLRIGLIPADSIAQHDLAAWLHKELEGDFGHDVYLVNESVDADALRDNCVEYGKRAEAFEARGDAYQKTAQAYRRAYRACKDLLDRDLIILLESADTHYEAFSARDRSMAGELRMRVQLLQVRSRRPLPAPRPQAITQYGYGDTAQLAQSNLQDRLYNAAANYVSQQINEALVTAVDDGRVSSQAGERSYQVAISGIDSDTPQGRAKVALVRDWFASEGGCPLEADFKTGNFGERIYTCRSGAVPDWDRMVDKLQSALDKAGTDARLDVDRSLNLSVAFQNQGTNAKPGLVSMKLEDSRIKRAVIVETKSMEVRRRDRESGVAIAVNEAVLRIRNKSGRDLLVDVLPVWTGQDGSSLPAPYSYRQTLRLPAKTSERFAIMAPSKFAGAVVLEIACPVKACRIPK